MGSKPPAREEPKYKLQILKMEFVPAYLATPENTSAVKPLKLNQKVK